MRQDDELDYDSRREKPDLRRLIPVAAVVLLFLIIITALLPKSRGDSGDADSPALSRESAGGAGTGPAAATEQEDGPDETNIVSSDDADDPQSGLSGGMSAGAGGDVDVRALLSADGAAETDGRTLGIDVAKYQGTIDWQQVAESGVDFVMVRTGYRTKQTGEIFADANARFNMQEAQANGIKIGAYFFSTAVTQEEAVEEADWVADLIAQYPVTYPVAYNCEGFDDPESRQYGLTQSERTNLAIAFLTRIYERGYTPMFYAAKTELEGDAAWDTTRLEQQFKLWMAWYPDHADPLDDAADGYAMWQYTNRGSVPGIPENVDLNIAYFDYAGIAEAKSDTAPEQVTADAEALMNFSAVNETVTAKEKVNLRDIPSQGSDSAVLATLSNGETVTRTGVSDSGWSRLESGGQVYYAVSSYLTTDLAYQAAPGDGSGSGDGLKTKFTPVSEQVTAKIEVNLRALPSVTNPDAVVVTVLHNGEVATRTGINTEYGWSRVEYYGQTLYCISSYLTGAE